MTRAAPILAGLIGLAACPAWGQSPTPPDAPAASPGALIREGSYLLQVKGSIHRVAGKEGGTPWWVFRVDRDDPSAALYELTMLPCTLLASLEQLVENAPDGETMTFDLTGQVFVYKGRNFLLPTHAPRLVEHVEPAAPIEPDEPDGLPEEKSPEEILRDLDRRVGAVPRSPRVDPPATTPDGEPAKLVPPGTLLRWRRGWMVREAGGAWTYVFSADTNALTDPPMVLMPCLLLEQMEQHAQRSGPASPLLVSGRVYRYRGRNYLLPTMFQVPRDHTPLR